MGGSLPRPRGKITVYDETVVTPGWLLLVTLLRTGAKLAYLFIRKPAANCTPPVLGHRQVIEHPIGVRIDVDSWGNQLARVLHISTPLLPKHHQDRLRRLNTGQGCYFFLYRDEVKTLGRVVWQNGKDPEVNRSSVVLWVNFPPCSFLPTEED